MDKKHKLNSIIATTDYGKTPGFQRPNHPDFMDSSELKKAEFTGMRKNELSMEWEFWVLGDKRRTVTFMALALDPLALTKVQIELFDMVKDQQKR